MKTHLLTSSPFITTATKQRPVAKQEATRAVELITSSLPVSQLHELSPTHRENITYIKQHVDHEVNGKITIGGKEAPVIKTLGYGGSKTVFDVEWDGHRLALALPNTTDPLGGISGKWASVLKEPENTAKIRMLGLCTNTLCEAVPVELDGVEFLGLVMNRYQDLPYLVLDSKNSQSSVIREPIIPEGGLNVDNFMLMFSPVIDDLATVLKNNIRMGGDCFSACIDEEGKLRMFFNDLGQSMDTTDKPASCATALRYAGRALDAWAASFEGGNEQIRNINPRFFAEFDKWDDDDPTSLQAKIANRIMERIS